MAEVRLENVAHRYPGAAADTLSGVSLTIARGEAHALLGGSGAGKTTLLNLLSGLLRPDAGAVVFDGRDVSAVPPRDRGVSQVFQFPVLYESLSVVDLLAFPLVNRGWTRVDARARSAEVARRLGFQARLDRRADALSLFEKQLVAIGRALVRPDIALVLLDEPLTAVEPATKWQLRRALKAAQRELGATMVYVTHDQTEALTFADRISVVHGGRILQTGTPQALYDEPDHEHVGHFIGSPGMNLVPGRVEAGAFRLASGSIGGADGLAEGVCTVGFRPEWAVLEAGAADGIPARVTGTRVLGLRDHRPEGIVTADVGGHPVRTRQAIDVGTGSRVRLRVKRALGFRDGVRMTAGVAEASGA